MATKSWIPIDEFLTRVKMTRGQLYNMIRQRYWRDGFVVKKPSTSSRWTHGCMEDYNKWLGI